MSKRKLLEVNIEDLADVCFTGGSTHVMKTCSIGGDKYFLKFSDEEGFYDGYDPSLQILVEYMAYSIYSLYSGIKIPGFKLVFDAAAKRVGLATTPAKGTPALGRVDPKILGKMMSQGVYVDIFLSNWDVVGTGTGNVFYDETEGATRIDPGGSLTFRAQGGRKGERFSPRAGDLKTMLQPGGAGNVFQYADLQEAAAEFTRVPWSSIARKIEQVNSEVSGELSQRGMDELVSQWQADVAEISKKLESRHKVILDHIGFVEGNGKVSESVSNSRLLKKFERIIKD